MRSSRLRATVTAMLTAGALALGSAGSATAVIGASSGVSGWPQVGFNAGGTNANPDETVVTSATVPRLAIQFGAGRTSVQAVTSYRMYGVRGGSWVEPADFVGYPIRCTELTCPPVFSASGGYVRFGGRGVAHAGQRVYAANGYTLSVYDDGCFTSCTPLWTKGLRAPAAGAPTVAGDTVYVVDEAGRLAAFPTSCTGGSTCTARWTAQVNSGVRIAVFAGWVYAASGSSLVTFPVDCSGACAPTWSAALASGGAAIAASADGVFVVAGGQVRAYPRACGAATCSPRWTATPPTAPSSLAVIQGHVYAQTRTGPVAYAVACALGGAACTPEWTSSGIDDDSSGRMSAAADVLYVPVGDHVLAWSTSCAASSCAPIWRSANFGGSVASVVIGNGRVIVNADEAFVFSIRPPLR